MPPGGTERRRRGSGRLCLAEPDSVCRRPTRRKINRRFISSVVHRFCYCRRLPANLRRAPCPHGLGGGSRSDSRARAESGCPTSRVNVYTRNLVSGNVLGHRHKPFRRTNRQAAPSPLSRFTRVGSRSGDRRLSEHGQSLQCTFSISPGERQLF